MKKIQLMISAVILAGALTACSDSHEAKKDVDNLSQYVDSVDQATHVYTVAHWTEIDNGYKDREAKIDATVQGEDKERAEASKAKYAALKARYEASIREKEEEAKKPDYRVVLRGNLFGEGKIGADMKMGWVTADNIKEVYEKFVNTVDDNKDKYSREDWDEIKLLYEALDSRKNEVEKDLATKDNLKIAALKVKFAAIKSVKRPMAKAEENEKAKD